MNKENLRPVEFFEDYKIKSLPGPGQSELGTDRSYDEGLFHGWDCTGDLKGIIELEDGTIKLIPYQNVKFLDK